MHMRCCWYHFMKNGISKLWVFGRKKNTAPSVGLLSAKCDAINQEITQAPQQYYPPNHFFHHSVPFDLFISPQNKCDLAKHGNDLEILNIKTTNMRKRTVRMFRYIWNRIDCSTLQINLFINSFNHFTKSSETFHCFRWCWCWKAFVIVQLKVF